MLDKIHHGFDTLLKENRPVNYLLAKEGLFEIRKTEVGFFSAKVKDNYNQANENCKEGFILNLPKKIPYSLLNQIISLFKDYCNKGYKYECFAQILWDKEQQEYLIDVPQQVVTRTTFDSLVDTEKALKYITVMDIHSHNNMIAYPSPRDDDDNIPTQLYCIVGRLDKFFPDLYLRISVGGKFVQLDSQVIFEYPFIDYPVEWNDNILLEGR